MDKKNLKKPEQNKTEDRGDNLKKIERTVRKTLDLAEVARRTHPGGDTEKKVNKADKPKVIIFKKSEDAKLKTTENVSKENLVKKEIHDVLNKPDKDERRKIREKYTLKLKNPSTVPSVGKKDEVFKVNLKIPIPEVKCADRPQKKPAEQKEKLESSLDSAPSDDKQDKKDRKPIIKTVTAKHDTTKVFKAVTFVDQKKKPTVLQIKIPNEVKNARNVKAIETVKKIKSTISKGSVREKQRKEKKKHRHRGPVASPDLSKRNQSPPTEVAKWAPSSINRHTKPYYEAWVSTTLAAIAKNQRKDKLFLEKKNILQTFQRALAERPETPELVYENCDERYTGRIKVKHR